MQVAKISKSQKNLRQGTIFSLKALKFDDGNNTTISFAQMYPKVDLKRINYAIVLSQTCDLVDNEKRKIKTPYVLIGLLEPTQVYFEEKFKEELQATIKKNTIDFNLGTAGVFPIINEDKVNEWIGKTLVNIFQNNDPFYYFVTIKQGKKLLLFNVNLTKTFAVRSSHHHLIFGKAKYQLKPFFENKLGWKLAEMYGRVGTPDYVDSDIKKLSKALMKNAEKTISEFNGHQVDSELFAKAKNLNGNGSIDSRKQFYSDEIIKINS